MKIPLDPARFDRPIAGLYRLWLKTLRFSMPRLDIFLDQARTGKPVIFALWHHDLFSLISYGVAIRWPMATIVSDSKDGEIIARALERLGFLTARGSSTRGGLKAVVRALRLMQEGRSLAVTIDGPKGPRHEVKDGILYIAARSGAPIVPVRAYATREYVFERSWDRFQLPLPFSKVRVVPGDPFHVPGELDEAGLVRERERLSRAMDMDREEQLSALNGPIPPEEGTVGRQRIVQALGSRAV